MEAWSYVHKKLEYDFKIILSNCKGGNGVPQGSKLSYHNIYNSICNVCNIMFIYTRIFYITNEIWVQKILKEKWKDLVLIWCWKYKPIKKIVMIVSNLENVDCKMYM